MNKLKRSTLNIKLILLVLLTFSLIQLLAGAIAFGEEKSLDNQNGDTSSSIQEEDIIKDEEVIKSVEEIGSTRMPKSSTFTFNESNVRDLLGINNQYVLETDINKLVLDVPDISNSMRGYVLRFHPNYKFMYMLYYYTNGPGDTRYFVSPDYPGMNGNYTSNINNIEPSRGLFPFTTNSPTSTIMTTNLFTTGVDFTRDNSIINQSLKGQIANTIFFKDNITNTIKGVAYNENKNYLLETTLSLDNYSYAGSVTHRLLNTADYTRNFALYETTEWQTNQYFSTVPVLDYAKDLVTPKGITVSDKNTKLEFSSTYRNSDNSFYGDNQFFYTGTRSSQMSYYNGSTNHMSGYLGQSFPYINSDGKVEDRWNTSQHRIGSVIGKPNTSSTGVSTKQKSVAYGEAVTYKYTYYFGKQREGLKITNNKNSYTEYYGTGLINNGVSIKNPNENIGNVDINLIIDGKEPQKIASGVSLPGNDISSNFSYDLDISDWELGNYNARVEVHDTASGAKSYGEPISISIIKTYTISYELDRTLSNQNSTVLGNDYFSISDNSLELDERFDNDIKKVAIVFPKNSRIHFWEGQDISDYVYKTLGTPTTTAVDGRLIMEFSKVNNMRYSDVQRILSSMVFRMNKQGDLVSHETVSILITRKNDEVIRQNVKIPGAVEISYMNDKDENLDSSLVVNKPKYVYGTYKVGDELPEFELEKENQDESVAYYPSISTYSFIKRDPSKITISEKNEKISYVYKKNTVNLTINSYQWKNNGKSTNKIVENLETGDRKEEITKTIDVHDKTIEDVLKEQGIFFPQVKGYTLDSKDTTKTLMGTETMEMFLTDKMPDTDFFVNYYYTPFTELSMPDNLSFGKRSASSSQKQYPLVVKDSEENPLVSIINTYETTKGNPEWNLYASTDGFRHKEMQGVSLYAELLYKSNGIEIPLSNEPVDILKNQSSYIEEITLNEPTNNEGLFLKVSQIKTLGEYEGNLKLQIRRAP